jgi:hypothetical protein
VPRRRIGGCPAKSVADRGASCPQYLRVAWRLGGGRIEIDKTAKSFGVETRQKRSAGKSAKIGSSQYAFSVERPEPDFCGATGVAVDEDSENRWPVKWLSAY